MITHPPTQQLLIPAMRPPLPRRIDPRRPSLGARVREEAAVIGIFLSCLAPFAYAIAELLGGAR